MLMLFLIYLKNLPFTKYILNHFLYDCDKDFLKVNCNFFITIVCSAYKFGMQQSNRVLITKPIF